MPSKKVIVYYMHEHEEAACNERIQDATWSAGMAVGKMDEASIEELIERDILVEVIEETPRRRAGGLESISVSTIKGRSPLAGPPVEAMLHPSKDNVFAIEIDGPFLMPEWRDQLANRGVEILERLPDGRFTAYLSLAQVPQVRDLPFTRKVQLFGPRDADGTVFADTAEAPGGHTDDHEPAPFLLYDVLLHRPEDVDDASNWLEQQGIKIVAAGRRKLRIELPAGSPLVRQVEARPEVREIVEYVEPTLANQIARRLLGLDSNSAAGSPLAQSGAGEIVAVADSGLDDSHPDFAGRIVDLVARGRSGDPSDPHGHGTHVAGSVLGDGSASGGAHRGTAPGAELFFQSIMDGQGRLSGLPVELGDLFDEAYQAGARIHNNSWSANTKSFYTLSAREVDEYVEEHPDLLITIAAGNEGSAANPFSAQTGFVDWQSIGSPATAKNALTVGASRNERSNGGYAGKTYRQFNSFRFSDDPIAQEKVSGDAECLAAFSARGPCDPRRIKPDVVAPGTDILSARASTAPESSFWGLLPGNNQYGYMGGTSMATPLVSGCAALVREYYRTDRQHEPSAALLKATLVNSTRRLTGVDAVADHAELPNYHQGFGAVNMPFAVPNDLESWLKLEFVDTWNGGPRFQPGGLDRLRLALQVQGGDFLRICLAWTDPGAGSSLQNIIGLLLEHNSLTPPKQMGNQNRQNALGRLDRDNNVQIIRIDNPPPGNYLLQLFGANLLTPQDWALVVTGDLAGGLIEI